MSNLSEATILSALEQIIDPDLRKDIVTLGFIRNLELNGGNVSFTIMLTTPACPVKEEMEAQAIELVSAIEGVTNVNVTMDAEVPQGRGIANNVAIPGVKNIIAVSSGKGGVGKTTTAAAAALRSAELGYRTLVVSTDIAHSLADCLDVPLMAEPIEVAHNLFAQEINVVEEVRKHWGKMQQYVGNVLRKQGMSKAIAEEMAIIPGMEEVVSLLHINKQAKEGHFDRVIVDAAPTGETIRLLTMPESFQW
ncbi:MAG TPA: TRC40/GET3/ArsA family transport-energizing ATPase, partial [Pyrinomonadaceae bacterium]|nr:TRC40/GET3/ArsA family transport-energizing ATPase [Pyrinomonadaceae bacterium]